MSVSLCAVSQSLVRWCDSTPCKNGGSCWQQGSSFTCQCASGWTGIYCDVPSVSCEVAAQQQGNQKKENLCFCVWSLSLRIILLY